MPVDSDSTSTKLHPFSSPIPDTDAGLRVTAVGIGSAEPSSSAIEGVNGDADVITSAITNVNTQIVPPSPTKPAVSFPVKTEVVSLAIETCSFPAAAVSFPVKTEVIFAIETCPFPAAVSFAIETCPFPTAAVFFPVETEVIFAIETCPFPTAAVSFAIETCPFPTAAVFFPVETKPRVGFYCASSL
ncbi:hypothetical protein MPER_02325, partial [Moniliophthora perniciosa FA553]